ncbi:hypothetical protein LINPERHAP2_LOCUS3760 [Linum perenne]
MIECSSPDEVRRILSLDRRSFGCFALLIGPWTSMAGRSRVAWDSNIAWMEVKGIPLHLRSSELAKCVGEVCGEFLELADGNDLSSFRVKVKLRGELPEVIPVSVGKIIFPVKVVPSLCFPWKCPGPKMCSDPTSKGKMVMETQQKELFSGDLDFEDADDPLPPMMVRGETSEYGGSMGLTGAPFSRGTDRMSSSDHVRRQKELGMCKVQAGGYGLSEVLSDIGVKVDGDSFSLSGLILTEFGLRLGNLKLVLDSGLLGSSVWTGGRLAVNEVTEFGPSTSFSGDGQICLQGKVGGLAREIVSGLAPSDPVYSPPLLSLLSKEGIESQEEHLCNEQGQMVLSSPHLPNRKVSQTEEPDIADHSASHLSSEDDQSEEVESKLVEEVRRIASLFQLEVKGSVEEGVSIATDLCRDSIRRRASSVKLSRTERELKKLGASPEVPSPTQRSRRGVRCVLPATSINEF